VPPRRYRDGAAALTNAPPPPFRCGIADEGADPCHSGDRMLDKRRHDASSSCIDGGGRGWFS